MPEKIDLEEHIAKGVERIVTDAVKASLKDPRESAFLLRFAAASRRATKTRKKLAENGEHIPSFLIASITSRCNLHCKMCFRETWVGESFKDMDMEVFMNAMDTMPDSVETVFFGGMGEPMFHPQFFEMLETAKKKGKT